MFGHFRLRQDEKGTWVSGGHVHTELLLGDVIELGAAGRFLLHGRTGDMVNIAGKRSSLAILNYHLNSIAVVRDGAFVIPHACAALAPLAAYVVAPAFCDEPTLETLARVVQ